jgi:predicted permease
MQNSLYEIIFPTRVLQDSDQFDAPWKYLGLLNECIKVVLTICIGSLSGYFQVFDASSFVPQATKFVFNVALPCLIIAGLGIGIDFYDESILWNFIGAFLVLRAIALLFGLLLVLANSTNGIGQIAVYWLCFTWISTGKDFRQI